MFFNLFLIILFAGSVGVLWHRISERIPELVAIPDEVIAARLHEDSARVRIFLLHARTFWREPRYRESFWNFCEKICYRAHIVLLRTDNGLMAAAKKIRAFGDRANAETTGVATHQEEKTTETAAYASGISVSMSPARISFASSLASAPRIISADDHAHMAPLSRPAAHAAGTRVQEVRKRRVKTALAAEPRGQHASGAMR